MSPRRGRVPGADREPAPGRWMHVPAALDAAPYLAVAQRIAAGTLEIFGVSCGVSPPRWNRDPKTGVEAPLSWGKRLDYRDRRRVGEIKYLWELNRHLHLVTLAQGYALSRDSKYLYVLREHLTSWFSDCPYGRGPNWCSALEAAIRLINWSIAWQLAGGAGSELFADREGERFREQWLASIYQHTRFVRGYFSRHSSANNHLIGEAAGLYIAGLTWPCWPELRRSCAQARRILEHEALLQNSADGVNLEQAVCYQQFVLDFLLLSLLAGESAGEPFSADYRQRIAAMLGFLASIMDAGGEVPMIGDADDGAVTRLAPVRVSHPTARSWRAARCSSKTPACGTRRGSSTTRPAGCSERAPHTCSIGCACSPPRFHGGALFQPVATTFSAATSRARARSAWLRTWVPSVTGRSRRTGTPMLCHSRSRSGGCRS
jgi:hypothetical protein